MSTPCRFSRLIPLALFLAAALPFSAWARGGGHGGGGGGGHGGGGHGSAYHGSGGRGSNHGRGYYHGGPHSKPRTLFGKLAHLLHRKPHLTLKPGASHQTVPAVAQGDVHHAQPGYIHHPGFSRPSLTTRVADQPAPTAGTARLTLYPRYYFVPGLFDATELDFSFVLPLDDVSNEQIAFPSSDLMLITCDAVCPVGYRPAQSFPSSQCQGAPTGLATLCVLQQ